MVTLDSNAVSSGDVKVGISSDLGNIYWESFLGYFFNYFMQHKV